MFILIMPFFIFLSPKAVAPEQAYLNAVNPLTGDQWFNFTTLEKSVDDTFIINITVANVIDLATWQFELHWNSSLLTYANATIPSDSVFGSKTLISTRDNSTLGMLIFAAAVLDPSQSFTGSGRLAQVELRIVNGVGDCPLSFAGIHSDTFLLDGDGIDISFTAVNGHYEYVLGIRDVSVVNLTSTKTIICQGYVGNITVTAENQGVFTENFNVTIYTNTTQIGVLNFILSRETSQAETFQWNTTDFSYGNYTLSVAADVVPGETDTADNNFTLNFPVHVGVPGDISGPTQGVYDGTCNMRDVQYLILYFNYNPSWPNWKPNADINNDGTVNMRDITIAILNFNKHE
jgi:hypothetical protein